MQISTEIPRLVPRHCGGWLALAPKGASLRIGVWADSEEAAREKYRTALDGWQSTLALRDVAAPVDADAGAS
jgi:hypothetical protein